MLASRSPSSIDFHAHPLIPEDPVNANTLCTLITTLPVPQPVTNAFEARQPATGRVWYTSQKEHLLGWLGDYHTPGAYGRQMPGQDAKVFYTRFQCVQGLMWLAEALGENEATLQRAIQEVDAAGQNPAAQCGAFRRVVPWTRIEALIKLVLSPQPGRQDVDVQTTLINAVRQAPHGQLLLPSAELWWRLGVRDATASAKHEALSSLRVQLRVTALDRKDAYYLEWTTPTVPSRPQKTRATPSSRDRRPVQDAPGPVPLDLTATHIRAISIRQPYAELILRGHKTHEYRTWSTTPGPILIHASKTVTPEEQAAARRAGLGLDTLPAGALVGVVEIVATKVTERNCVWVLAHPQRFVRPLPWKGASSIMQINMDAVRAVLDTFQ